jgi:hypothetical protein
VSIWCENLSGLWRENPRLSLFGGRISPDYGWRVPDFHFPVGESLHIMAGGFQIFIFLWENLSRLWCEGFKIVIFLWENLSRLWCEGFKIVILLWKNLSGLWREDPRLSLFGGRITPDCGGRIQDCHYSVGESLRIVVGGFKTGITL